MIFGIIFKGIELATFSRNMLLHVKGLWTSKEAKGYRKGIFFMNIFDEKFAF